LILLELIHSNSPATVRTHLMLPNADAVTDHIDVTDAHNDVSAKGSLEQCGVTRIGETEPVPRQAITSISNWFNLMALTTMRAAPIPTLAELPFELLISKHFA
jgi:hypothetical protein